MGKERELENATGREGKFEARNPGKSQFPAKTSFSREREGKFKMQREGKFEACISGNHGKREFPFTPAQDLPPSLEGLELEAWHYIRASPFSLSPKLASRSSAAIGIRHHFGIGVTHDWHQGVKQGGIRHSWHCRPLTQDDKRFEV